eukprot:scaffold5961_cov66-Phaeocystis_antarctica.AAC.2
MASQGDMRRPGRRAASDHERRAGWRSAHPPVIKRMCPRRQRLRLRGSTTHSFALNPVKTRTARKPTGTFAVALDGCVILVPRSGTTSWPRRGLGAAPRSGPPEAVPKPRRGTCATTWCRVAARHKPRSCPPRAASWFGDRLRRAATRRPPNHDVATTWCRYAAHVLYTPIPVQIVPPVSI